MKDLVSIIIPTHFRPDRVACAIRSAQKQTYNKLEIIVVSDGSDRETEETVMSIAEMDERVKFFSYQNSQGGNHARNVGIQEAKGKYIAFLDDDDIWYEDKVLQQLRVFSKNNKVGLVGCGINVFYADKGISYKTLFKERGDLSKKILKANIIGSTSCVMLKKEVIKECGAFDETIPARQDHDLWIRVCQKYLVDFVDSVQLDYYVYESNGKSQQVSKSLDKYIRAHEILMEKYKILYEKLPEDEYKELMSARYLGIAKRALEVGNSKLSKEYGKIAWRYYKSKKALWFMFFSWIPYSALVKIRTMEKVPMLFEKSKTIIESSIKRG